MPGKTPHNGKKPVENGVKKTKDAEVKDSGKSKGKKAAKDGDEEMTVVVPPSKTSKQASVPAPDADGDVSMGDEAGADAGEIKVDPAVQTVIGKPQLKPSLIAIMPLLDFDPEANATPFFLTMYRYQEQFWLARSCRCPFRYQILAASFAINFSHPQAPNTRHHRTSYCRHLSCYLVKLHDSVSPRYDRA